MPPLSALKSPSGIRAGSVEPRRFRPRLSLGYYQSLVSLVHDLRTHDFAGRVEAIQASIDAAEELRTQLVTLGVSVDALQPTVYYQAAIRLLRDLVLQGWFVDVDDGGIYFLPPTLATVGDDTSAAKLKLRNSFKFAKADQLLSDSVSAFVARMEKHGVATLFADGPDLADRLGRIDGTNAASTAIRPVLELITSNAHDACTGLRLQDIWRYARLQWSIPYQQTPGRNIHYLIRDEAGPNRPIIGIVGLGNPVLGLSQRDEALGWSTSALSDRLESASAVERYKIANHLVEFMRAEYERVYKKDLGIDCLPAGDAVTHLLEIERSADSIRRVDLGRAGEFRTEEYLFIREMHNLVARGQADDVDWMAVAETQLYRRKRAANLADTIRALTVFEESGISDGSDNLLELLRTEVGQRAVKVALRRIKQQAVAENIMEIITCGAVPPYNQILGGKLVAMLVASPQVVCDLRDRYDGKVSLIASGMAGYPVRRTPALSVLTTSSLYALGSAQYNRIRIPGPIAGGVGEIRYTRVGTTDSFGTVQFASDTTESLLAVAHLANDGQRVVNNLFGEGTSPKLRSLRMGLDGLGLRSNDYLRHHSPRLLYVVPLATNAFDILLGLSRCPDYILPQDGGAEISAQIASYWYERWAKPRLKRSGTVEKIRESRRDDHLLSKVASKLGTSVYVVRRPQEALSTTNLRVDGGDDPITFVERLYRNANSYADRLTLEELDWLHVDLDLDEYLLTCASDGLQLIMTGNPGDGKTFVIERLRQVLESTYNAVVITDANACSDTEILQKWRSCHIGGRAFVLAINEWPLLELERLATREGFEPVTESVRQVRSAVYFGDPPDPPRDPVRVIDLNLRDILTRRVIFEAVERLIDDRFTSQLTDTDPAKVNVTRLRTHRAKDRLASLLEQAARRGEHTTMRQLMGFLAYLITGGTNATVRATSQGDGRFCFANLVFEGGIGPLFDLVRRSLDPAVVTHPEIDEELWRGTTDPSEWLDENDVPIAPASCAAEDRDYCFRIAKRRFYFEHARGDELLGSLPSDESAFDRVLAGGLEGDPQLVREMVLAINRFFEPDCPSEDGEREITLWQSHRYDVRAPTAFVSLYKQSSEAIEAETPQLAEWVTLWLPPDMRRMSQFALTVTNAPGTPPSRLLVDREVYLTLRDAAAGLGHSTWSRSVARKVTRFADELHRNLSNPLAIADLDIRNVETNRQATVQVRFEQRKYRL